MSDILLSLKNISTAYGQSQVLWDIDLEIRHGEAMALIGRNGVGKTTLLRAIMGVQPALTGSIDFDNEDVTNLKSHLRARAGVGLVPQGRHIFPHLTVMENLETGLSARGGRGEDKVPDYIFDLFPKLGEVRKRNGGFLSGGEQQQLAIGRALAGAPKLLLLDEPTEGIQPNVVQQIEDALRSIRTELGVSILIVEQYIDFVWRFADSFCAMQQGKIVARDSVAAVSVEEVAHLVRI
ncbi:MAG: urea ABC transporter ATP-binding subunit UrtE [Pseudomonadota bacterium]